MLHMSAQCYEHWVGYCTNAKTCFNVHIGAILAERRVLVGLRGKKRRVLSNSSPYVTRTAGILT